MSETTSRVDALILDTETTSTADDLEVVELAYRGFEIGVAPDLNDYYVSLFKPMGGMSLGALATHHILPSELEGMRPSAEAAKLIPSASYWIGHNVDFDWKALGQPPVRRICTLAMCRSIWPNCDSHSLTAMMYFLEGMTPETRARVREAHGAGADIHLCLSILTRIIEDEGIKTLSDLWLFSEDCRVPKIMTFGKFKSRPISDVDRGWANWYQRQEDTDPYLIEALRRARKL